MKHVTIICGPTASGKSAFGISMSKKLNGVIVNADSRQIYKDIEILTASPSEDDKKTVKHCLYNFLDLTDEFSVASYLKLVTDEVSSIHASSRHPIIIGGTGMYINALVNGISYIPDIHDEIRESARKEFNILGKSRFYDKLSKIDQYIEKNISNGDSQRMIRAYEVFLQTGKSISYYHKNKLGGLRDKYKLFIVKLMPERELLYKRCDKRFVDLLAMGAVEEVRGVIEKYETYPKILGFDEIRMLLDGKISIDKAIMLAQTKTRQYAKRQVTWFKHQIDCDMELQLNASDNLDCIINNLCDKIVT